MINRELLNYIETELTRGTTLDVIKSNLLLTGWNIRDIEDAISTIVSNKPEIAPVQPKIEQQPVVTKPAENLIKSEPSVTPTKKVTTKNPGSVFKKYIFTLVILLLVAGAFVVYTNKDNISISFVKTFWENLENTVIAVLPSSNEQVKPTETTKTEATTTIEKSTTTQTFATSTINTKKEVVSTSSSSTSTKTTKATTTPNLQKTYSYNNGAFTFQYPSGITVLEKNNSYIALASSQNSATYIYYITIMSSSSVYENYGNNLLLKNVTTNGYKIYSVDSSSMKNYSVYVPYIVSYQNNAQNYIVALVVPNTFGYSYQQLYPILNSLYVNNSKMTLIKNSVIDNTF